MIAPDAHRTVSHPAYRFDPAADPAPAGAKKCAHPDCGKVKPLDQFYRRDKAGTPSSYCKSCHKRAQAASANRPEGKARQKEYNRLDRVRIRKREHDRKRYEARKAAKAAYAATPRARVGACLSQARARLKVAEARCATLRDLIAGYEFELYRMNCVRDGIGRPRGPRPGTPGKRKEKGATT
jgi:hypothetical protein